MSVLITGLSEELFDDLQILEVEETESTEESIQKPAKESVPKLLGTLKSVMYLRRKTEHEYNQLELDHEKQLIELKREAMAEGLKSTEAKEYAKKETYKQQKELLKLEKDISLLKDYQKYVEKELKYKYLELQKECDINDNFKQE